MAEIIREPEDHNPMTEDWQLLLSRTTFQGGGYIQLTLTNIDNQEIPKVESGSRIEVGGSFYKVNEDEAVDDPDEVAVEQVIFIYAKPLQNSLAFVYGNEMPEWDTIRCGYYNGDSRAIAKMYKHSEGLFSKVVLINQESLYQGNWSIIPEKGEGKLIKTGTVTGVQVALNPGVYRLELRGGRGGIGGHNTVGWPPDSAEPVLKEFIFLVEQSTTAVLVQGEGGGSGGGGMSGEDENKRVIRTGGGGGAAGGTSYLKLQDNTIYEAAGTSGTNGAASHTAGGNAGTVTVNNTGIHITAPTAGVNYTFQTMDSVYNTTGHTIYGGAAGTINPDRRGFAGLYLITLY